jgi:hypothetical protein
MSGMAAAPTYGATAQRIAINYSENFYDKIPYL